MGMPKRWVLPHHHVGTQLARWREQGQGQDVGGHDDQAAPLLVLGDQVFEVVHRTLDTGVLQQQGKAVVLQRLCTGAHLHAQPQRRGAGLNHL